MFGDICEKLVKDLQSAGNAGEFYTPRVVTLFIIEQVNPRLDRRETILDPACGQGERAAITRTKRKKSVRFIHHLHNRLL